MVVVERVMSGGHWDVCVVSRLWEEKENVRLLRRVLAQHFGMPDMVMILDIVVVVECSYNLMKKMIWIELS
jgi:hypothetical protein